MSHTYALGRARASSASNPITFSYTVARGDTVLVLLLNVVGAAVRAGGAPTWGSVTLTQANSAQIAAASPEASAEIWYLENPVPGTATLSIPNSGSLTIFHTVALGRAALGGSSKFEGANGGNGTSTNPTPGAVTVTAAGGIGFAVAASGATTWGPSAQVGTAIANTDDGANGGGEQYILNPAIGSHTLGWTFGTSDDWGAVSAYFREIPPCGFNNQMVVRVPDGISTTERWR